ncbi:hypothetical protein NQ314_016930 [Rhamnusium bicolor]|uniref:DDE Tnp4 domain-containing protein n=1 Tax=Rhamnusium bicolor TaxID=1586634 RepID=A0AAV8WVL0_9CUCU|nr:hypothetical protein NQ314_016930 [Rhamnusium bicolor]
MSAGLMLAAGDSLPTLAFAYHMARCTVSNIIKETCEAIWQALQPVHLAPPETVKWKQIACDFFEQWQMPNCVGAAIKAPNESGSAYFNYKKYHSIILFAVCDANYMFTHVNIGSYGSQSDGGILTKSEFGQHLENGTLNMPADDCLPGSKVHFPYYFVGDDAFPLKFNLLTPYGGKYLDDALTIFNYRLSRARRCIENAFGILVARWRIFHKTINAFPTTVDSIVKATVCLHNYIKMNETSNSKYCNSSYSDQEDKFTGKVILGQWGKDVEGVPTALRPAGESRHLGPRNARQNAVRMRNIMTNYVNSRLGSVPWQVDYIRK